MLDPFWSTLGPPLSGLRPSLVPNFGLIFEGCFGIALGVDTATIKQPDLRILGVPGEEVFTSFPKEES